MVNSLPRAPRLFSRSGQVAMEYLILLGLMTVIALMAFRTLVPNAVTITNQRFNSASTSIIGESAESHTGVSGPWFTNNIP